MCSAFLNCAIFFDSVKFGGQDTHLKVAEQQIKEKPLRNTPAYELFFRLRYRIDNNFGTLTGNCFCSECDCFSAYRYLFEILIDNVL